MEHIEIQSIKINKLFSMFDYHIDLNNAENLTIMTGPNGYGKTTILNIMYNVFNQRFFYFQKLDFESISFYFTNGMQIEISKKKGKDKEEKRIRIVNNQQIVESQIIEMVEIHISLLQDSSIIDTFVYNSEIENKLLMELEQYNQFRKISPNLVSDFRTRKRQSLRDFLIENIDYLPLNIITVINKQGSKKIADIFNSINVYIIREERLQTQMRENNQIISINRTIEQYADELKNIIAKKQSEAYQITQELDSSFPKRLIECSHSFSEDEFNVRFAQLTDKQEKLLTFGIVTSKQDVTAYDAQAANVLTVYLEDSEKKVSVYDDLVSKIELFVSILNDKSFICKNIIINGTQGFYFQTCNGQQLHLSDLSSGEQHEVVLLYELLFKTNSNTLILIDEPEISLHVMWQKAFIHDLQSIGAIKQISFLVATHSPQIINGKWEITRDLYTLHNAN